MVRQNLKKFYTKKDLLNFTVNHDKRISEYRKSLKSSGDLSVEQHKKVKAVSSRPGVFYGLCEVHKNIVDRCPPFEPIFSANGTLPYEITKFLVPGMNSRTSNKLTVKDNFCFGKEILE